MSVLAAIEAEDAAALVKALASGADPDVRDASGCPALVRAAHDEDLVAVLLDARPSLEATAEGGETALVTALLAGAAGAARRLLDAGADPNRGGGGETPLTAALTGSPESALRVLNYGADPRVRREDGWDPLMLAAWKGDLPLVRLLLEHGADPTATVGARLTDAATIAAVHGHGPCRDVLVEAATLVAPRLRDLWEDIAAWCEEHAPELHASFENTVLTAPAPADWGRLPVDAAQLLSQWPGGLPFYGGMTSLGVDGALHWWRHRSGDVRPGVPPGLVADEPIRPLWWDPAWVPVARHPSGRLLFVDQAPLATGVPGQLAEWTPDGGPRCVVASSLTAYLVELRDGLHAGRVRYDEARGELVWPGASVP
ncbi:MAG: ankyrin repeat domain-containing protein [Alphaproteobacteria bacterium]|nr:ankyrin repeat domain-containing protein [Alphaproteobacteria bacterium]